MRNEKDLERRLAELCGEKPYKNKKVGASRVYLLQSPFIAKHFRDWIEERQADGISFSARELYFYAFAKFLQFLESKGRDLAKLEKVSQKDLIDFKKAMRKPESKFFLKSTSAQIFLINVRMFLEFLGEKIGWNEDFRSVNIPKITDKKVVEPEDLITKAELEALLRHASNRRDKCLIAILFETGLRIQEALDIRIKDIQKEDEYMSVKIRGTKTKNAKRRLVLIESWKYIVDWLNEHPFGNDPEAYLFVNLRRNYGEPFAYHAAYYMFKRNLKRAGLRHINPHLWRHTAASREAVRGMNPKLMNLKFGWEEDSRVPFTYIALNDETLEVYELKRHGLATEEQVAENGTILKPKVCPRCAKINDSDARVCQVCESPLDAGEILEQLDKLTRLVEALYSEKGVDSEEMIKRGFKSK